MAEASVVSGFVSLVPLCRDGLDILQEVFSASHGMQRAVDRIKLQTYRYDEWTDSWETDHGPLAKFESYAAANPLDGERVFSTLTVLAKLMFDISQLARLYSLQSNSDINAKPISTFGLTSRSVQLAFINECRTKIPLMRECRFVGNGWERLTQQIREYGDQLRTFGLPKDLARLKKSQFEILFSIPFEQLPGIVDASTQEARTTRKESADAAFYTEFALAAQFRKAVHVDKEATNLRQFMMRNFKFDSKYKLLGSENSTMALLYDYPYKTERRVVLVEWVYINNTRDREEVLSKASALASPMSDQMLLPTCFGIVEDNKFTPRIGLVLAPPGNVSADLPKIMPPGAISQRRMPASLRDLLAFCTYPIDLSLRFELAKKLVDAVHMMHCVGWAHKNFRPTSILFFPLDVSKPVQLALSQRKWNVQPTNPFIVGFQTASVDDVPNIVDAFESFGPSERRGSQASVITVQSVGLNDPDWYEHPEKRKNPTIRYSPYHDLYSLGCVLLEIGMWQSLNMIAATTTKDPRELQKHLLGTCETRLKGFAGGKYAGVVQRCLSVPSGHRTMSEGGGDEISELLVDLASRLDHCAA